jgi:cellulose synthase operon protein C
MRFRSVGPIFLCLSLVSVVSCGGAARKQAAADDGLRRGNRYFDLGQLSEAIIEYRAALEVDPKRADIRLRLADTYFQDQQIGNGIKEYLKAADLLPNDAAVQLRAGNAQLAGRHFEDAKARANRILENDSKSIDGLILLGNAMAGLKDVNEAVADYEEALALDPTNTGAYLNLGVIQSALGEGAEAEASFKKAVEVAPKSVRARMALGNFLWASRRSPEAEQVFKDALLLDPASVDANRALGSFYLATNRSKEAEQYFVAVAATAKTTGAALSLADYYATVGRSDEARSVLNELAKKDSARLIALTRLATIDAGLGHSDQALKSLTALLEQHPKDVSLGLLRARVLLLEGKPDDALAQATQIVTDRPESTVATDAYLLIGSIQMGFDRSEEAINAFQEVIRRQTQSLAADMALSQLYVDSNELEKAMMYAQQAKAIQPQSVDVQALFVRIGLASGDMTRVREALAPMQREAPSSPIVLSLQGAEQMRLHHYDAARAFFAKAAQLVPTALEPLAGLVDVDLATGHTKDAVARIETGLKLVSPSGNFLILAARTYRAAGDPAKAEELLKRAIEVEPSAIESYGLLGDLYVQQHRVDEATAQFTRVVQHNPKSVSANTMLAVLLEMQHRLPEAEQQYERVLVVDAHAAVAANNLAWLYAASNRNLERALELAQTALRQMPDNPHANDTVGWVLYRSHQASDAVRYLEASVQKDPTSPARFYHLGMAYLDAGYREKARISLRRALAFKTDFDGALEARGALARLGG